MRRQCLQVVCSVLLFSGGVFGQSFVQVAANTSSSTSSFSVSFSTNTTAGNIILVGTDYNTTFSSISDSQGNTFAEVGTELTTPGGAHSRLYYAPNIKGGADTVTVKLASTASYLEIYLTEYSGVAQVSPLDTQSGASGTSGTASSGSATTSAGDLIYGYCVSDWACVGGSGFNTRSSFNGNLVEDTTVSSAGSYAATGSSSSGWAMQMAALKPASSGSSGTGTPLNSCDLATPYGTIDSSDVQAAINMSIGISPCTANIVGAGVCNVVAVQRVINAALPSGTCVTGTGTVSHSVTLSWVASTTSNVTYNIYRSTTSGVYSTSPYASSGAATTYTDATVSAGLTYYYVVTAVSGSTESAHSNETTATIPTP